MQCCVNLAYYPPDRREGGNKRCFCPSVCPSIAYIANNSRTQRPSVPKFGMKVPHLRCDSRTIFKVKRSKVRVTDRREHTMSAEPSGHTACWVWQTVMLQLNVSWETLTSETEMFGFMFETRWRPVKTRLETESRHRPRLHAWDVYFIKQRSENLNLCFYKKQTDISPALSSSSVSFLSRSSTFSTFTLIMSTTCMHATSLSSCCCRHTFSDIINHLCFTIHCI